jgi:hypothetical protein
VGLAVGTKDQIGKLHALRRDDQFAQLLPIGKMEALALQKAVKLFADQEKEAQRYAQSGEVAQVFAERLNASGLYQARVFEKTRLGQAICTCEATICDREKLPLLVEKLQKAGIMIGKAPEDPGTYIINPLLLKPDQIDEIIEAMTEV